MFARIAVVAAALAAAPSAFATGSSVADLSRDTGVSERHIRMVAGGRTAYAEYRIVYDRVERRLKAALGEDGYGRLLQGDVAAAQAVQREPLVDTAVAARTPVHARAPQG